MMKVDHWIVYYADGSIFTSDQGSWAECPPFGVAACIFYDIEDRVLVSRSQRDVSIHYHPELEAEEWVEIEGVPVGMDVPVKMGLWTDDDSYWRVHDLVRRRVTPTP